MRTLIAVTTFVLALAGWFGPGQAMEQNRDRPGGDFTSFNIGADPKLCKAACKGNPACQAWTYVKPGYQGPSARCWLKNTVPPKVKNKCCVSGTKDDDGPGPGPGPVVVLPNTDRPGGDFTSVTLPHTSNASACLALCNADGACRA